MAYDFDFYTGTEFTEKKYSHADINAYILPYGYVISEETYNYLVGEEALIDWCRDNGIKSEELEKTLLSLGQASTKAALEKDIMQLLHYLGVSGDTFRDDNKVRLVEKGITVVDVMSKSQVRDVLISKIYSNIALKSDEVKAVYTAIGNMGVEYKYHLVRNKEFSRIFMKPSNIDSSKMLLEYLLYNHADTTMVVNSSFTYGIIAGMSKLIVEDILNTVDPRLLAVDFNRYKKLILALKCKQGEAKTESINATVNRISKLAKVLHEPLVTPDYLQLTSKDITAAEFEQVVQGLDNTYLVKVYQAFKMRMQLEIGDPIQYRIRNGRTWIEAYKGCKNMNKFYILEHELQERFNGIEVTPENSLVQYVIPASMKQATGDIPDGSFISLDETRDLVVGIYWEDNGSTVDLDLSVNTSAGKIGWDSPVESSDIVFSGDIMSAENGATELIKINATGDSYVDINAAGYHVSGKVTFKFFIGYHEKEVKSNANSTIFDNVTVLYSDSRELTEKENVNIGTLLDGMFIFDSSGASGRTTPIEGTPVDLIEMKRKQALSKPLVRDYFTVVKGGKGIIETMTSLQ